tara:strand:+ start:224 stop:631 length:408 start_codon:yes stop_codon:yes gene_type:complete
MNTASLTFSEVAELFYIAMETQDRFFEFWITATFAVVIACHLGSKTLTKGFSTMISLLYLAFSANMIARWYLAGGAVGSFRNAMTDGMTQLGGFMNPESQEILMYISRISSRGTLFIGTAMTIFFVWYTFNNQKQ